MFVAEVFTGLPGVFTPVEETADSFEQLVNGDLDALPEPAFLNVGGAQSARPKAAELRKSAGASQRPCTSTSCRRRPSPGPGGPSWSAPARWGGATTPSCRAPPP